MTQTAELNDTATLEPGQEEAQDQQNQEQDAQAQEQAEGQEGQEQAQEQAHEPNSIEAREATWARIAALEVECSTLESEWESAKEEASDCKKAFEAAVERLRKAIRSANEQLPLFDAAKQPAAAPVDAGKAAEPVEDESWKLVPLTDVLYGLPAKKVQILADAELVTLGQLTDFQAAKGGFDWGIKGIGSEWRTKIEDAVISWLEKWRADQALNQAAAIQGGEDATEDEEAE